MNKTHPESRYRTELNGPQAGILIGRIITLDGEGRVMIEFPGSPGVIPARVSSTARERLSIGKQEGREVLVVLQDSDPKRPIVIDTLHSLLDEVISQPEAEVTGPDPDEVLVDGKHVVLEGEEQIVLRCGEASITLTRAGKVIIRGAYVVSRSSGVNRIKGAAVDIN